MSVPVSRFRERLNFHGSRVPSGHGALVKKSTLLLGPSPEEVAPSGQQFFLGRVGVPADLKWQASRLPYVWRSMTQYRQFFVDTNALSAPIA